ncbi:tRNA lysidine(34) synthetase TilS [Halomonas sp. GXIMD04776]|uniref:tRNA lysidine(34) synthetase TilS n=1 Tax=Halomonas sp. GXIMD04776 TaxID=3415605 RepID=UPI003C9C7612
MSPDSLIANALAQSPPDKPVWVALSGGLDSCLLLTLAARAAHRFPRPVYAVHVNHGLQSAAIDFEWHCRRLCGRLGVPLFVEQVQVDARGQGIEAAARETRYAAFVRRVREGESLWLAQHADDQAETLLLAALRGSGVRGLAGMPSVREWQGRCVMRPLLERSRSELEGVARKLDIDWIEDPTNADIDLDRNFLRHRVMPLLTSRWSQALRSLAQSAHLAGEADELLDELAALDLAAAGGEPHRLRIEALRTLSAPRQRLLIRHACQRLELPTPPAARLATLLEQLDARDGAQVRVVWPGAEARCWRDRLYLQAPMSELPAHWQCDWDGRPGLMTPVGRIEQGLFPSNGAPGAALRLTLRRGGESLRVAGRGRRDVKRLLQEAAIPPWQRSRQLLAWHEGVLVAVLGVAVAQGWRQTGQASVVS